MVVEVQIYRNVQYFEFDIVALWTYYYDVSISVIQDGVSIRSLCW